MLRQATQKTPITALYARLSKDDEQQGESLSIENQKRILETFARDNGFLNCRFFVDGSSIVGLSQKELAKQVFSDLVQLFSHFTTL